MQLKASKRSSKTQYHPASASLLRNHGWETRLPKLPNVLRMSAQFKPLVAIWESCIDELKAFNREHRKVDGEMTADVYESLPPELRQDDHPEYDAWMNLWERHADAEGWPLVPVSELAGLKKIDERPRLTKNQSHRIVRTANAIGLGLVPDVDVSEKNYGWNQKVCLFFEEPSSERNLKAYKSASILLRLGMSIAGADGDFDDSELAFIDNHLESTFDLSDSDSKRLECLTYLLANCPESNFSITKKLCTKLTKAQRSLVGEFLVGIAAADGILHKSEINAIKKAYRALELEPRQVDELLARFSTSKEQPMTQATEEPAFNLDMNAIAEIMTETRQVSKLLEEAMEFGEASGEREAEPVTPDAKLVKVERVDPPESIGGSHFDGLSPRYHKFLEMVLSKAKWSEAELDSLARSNGQMLTGAVEAINEWSYENFENWIIEEGDEYTINAEILVSQ